MSVFARPSYAIAPMSAIPLRGPAELASRARFGIVVALFLVSGATALVDQLAYSKYLSTVVGSTAHAVSAVLAAFMAGLCLGAWLGGRWSERVRNPLLAYGVAELVVAGAVALSPVAFAALTPAYVTLVRLAPDSVALLSVLRWLVAVSLVAVPTTAMGATLPLLTRALGAQESRLRERRLGTLYAANTLGGAVGALAAAYAVLPLLGIGATLFSSAALSALVGVAAIGMGRRYATPRAETTKAQARSESPRPASDVAPSDAMILGILAFASGALVFAAEVVFTHLLAVVVGNSAYAFGVVLAVFLICLFFGASRAAWAWARFGAAALPLCLAATGLALCLALPLWDELPRLFAASGEILTTFASREAFRGLLAFAILAVPTSLMGLTFPLLLQRVAGSAQVGLLVGRLTAINTVGAVFGALGAGYLLLPTLGSEIGLRALAAAYAACALATSLAKTAERRARRGGILLAVAAVCATFVVPRWDLARLTNGANVYFDPQPLPDRIVFVREDVQGGVTTVTDREGVRALFTNGKFQGNNGWEMEAQRMFCHYPSMFVSRFERALVIGLGTGTTLGTLAAYPWRRIDVVEISPAIVEAAGAYFAGPNRGALRDPRVRLTLADGRNDLLVREDRYDLIGMELSSIWFAGASSLYSREYYALVRKHLAPGGIFQQWVQLHHIYERDLATILHTLRAEFQHVALFYGGGQGILVASETPLRASLARLSDLQRLPPLAETIPAGRKLPDLLDDLLVLDAGLDGFITQAAARAGTRVDELASSDDNLYLEYATPRGNVLPWDLREALVARLHAHRDPTAVRGLLVP